MRACIFSQWEPGGQVAILNLFFWKCYLAFGPLVEINKTGSDVS